MLPLLKQTASEWMEDDAPSLGAALAYYTVFSLAPLMTIAIAIAGFFFGKEAAQGQILTSCEFFSARKGAKRSKKWSRARVRSQRSGSSRRL
jgi:membrane protein